MNQHTPGPWEVAYYDKNGQAVVKSEHIEIATCWHHCVGAIEKEMKANARLIAAAPELLEALKGILAVASVRIDDPRIAQWDAARAAIAIATGERT